jgi:DNA-binding transcriptional ArsR family regulator
MTDLRSCSTIDRAPAAVSRQRRGAPAVDGEPDLAAIAAAIGERSRARMLSALMGGQALTATELAIEAGVSASTASSHLLRLQHAGLVVVVPQGRHRYVRIATSTVASVLESLMGVAAGSTVRRGPREQAMRRARVCYDHLAGERGVQLFDRMHERRLIRCDGGSWLLTADGEAWLAKLGVDVAALRQRARPLVRACLDWSERRDHLAGAVGAAILARLFERRLVRRDPLGRAVSISPRGERFLTTLEI